MLLDVGAFTQRSLSDGGRRPGYEAALHAALAGSPPAYAEMRFVDEFRYQAKDPSWFASLLVSDCDLEGYSGGQLARYAKEIADRRLASGLAAHAADEARHSRIFASLLFGIFPQLAPDLSLRAKLAALAPRLKAASYVSAISFDEPDEALLSSMVLINLHEVKALVLEQLLKPVALAHAPDANRQKIHRQFQVLIDDELQHIRYSAEYIEHAATLGWGDTIADMMVDYQQLMNQVTLEEVETRTPHALAEELRRE